MQALKWLIASALIAAVALSHPTQGQDAAQNLLKNPSFEEGLNADGIPQQWKKYGGGGKDQGLSLVENAHDEKAAMSIKDDDAAKPFGIMQTVAIEGGKTYTASVQVKALEGGSPNAGTLLLKLEGKKGLGIIQFGGAKTDEFTEFSVVGQAPPGSKTATVYVYSRKQRNCKFIADSVRLVEGGSLSPPLAKRTTVATTGGRRLPGAETEPPPVYAKLKDLHISTALVKDGKPTATIVAPQSGQYAEQAKSIALAVQQIANVELPVISDTSPQAAVPIQGNLIALGNRSTNKTIEELYNRHFTLLDLKYPGQGGHVVRTLHNPFGHGHNVVFIGGSNPAGVQAATRQFAKRLKEAAAKAQGQGNLSVGWIADIQLPPGLKIPTDMDQFPLWSASDGYHDSGVFGWTIMTKRAALYYMTGDEFHAREFLRLSFPDKKAVKEIRAIDKGKVDITDPLTGLDHYRSYGMILYWDLIEESPVFTDAERLKVTNAFARSLKHRQKEQCYRYPGPAPKVGSRHGQWGAVCVYTLCRYFARDYPEPLWKEGLRQAEWEFASLHEYDWVQGENDNLFWYTTSMEPLTNYLLLSGDRVPIEKGIYKKLMTAQEALLPGIPSHRHVHYGALNWFHKAAYLLRDGRWIFYRNQTKLMDEDVPFRLGQSFWPEESLAAKPPTDLIGKWTVDFMPEARWKSLQNGFPLEETFTFMSFRSAPDATGDYILLDGYNGQGRNPYHCFAIPELRIDGHTVLIGHENQVISKVDGMVEPVVAKYAALKDYGVVGDTAFAVAEVPNAGYCDWRRTLAQRVGRYALIVDDLTFRTSSENVEIQTRWRTLRPTWNKQTNRLLVPARKYPGDMAMFAICPSDISEPTIYRGLSNISRYVAVTEGQRITSFSLLAPEGDKKGGGPTGIRLSDNSVVLRLPPTGAAGPQAGIAIAGEYGNTKAKLAVVTESHLFGLQMTKTGIGRTILSADKPIDADWDFASAKLCVEASDGVRLSLAISSDASAHLDGKPLRGESVHDGLTAFTVPKGKHVLEGMRPDEAVLGTVKEELASLTEKAQAGRAKALAQRAEEKALDVPALEADLSAKVDGRIVDLEVIARPKGTFIAAAVGKTIHVFDLDGREVQTLETEADMRVIHWWKEADLLLAGCKDDKVIAFAFDPTKKTSPIRWEFTSEMAPWVYTHQASHWWKEAGPHHRGIHGLTSGHFLDQPATQAIVGSACTVEVLDENGKLLERKEQIWGDVVLNIIIPGPDGSRNLLSMRRPSLTSRVNILNSRTLKPGPAGFWGVPDGYTNIKSWGRSRHHLIHTDLDGDGTGEVVGDINGPWDRIGVWNESGAPKYNAPFGPGSRASRSLRDLDVADLDGDGKKEILVATDRGLLIALDHQCRKVWSKRLPIPAWVLKAIVPAEGQLPRIVLGCHDGGVLVLDSTGTVLRRGALGIRPDRITAITKNGKPHALLTTTKGIIKAFPIGE